MHQAIKLPIITKRRIISDVETVKKEAQHLLILKDNQVLYQANEQGALSIIAVIGESFSPTFGYHGEALLCEVGISRTRPYSFSLIPKHLRHLHAANSIKDRRKLFHLTKDQYLKVAPTIFGIIKKLANSKIEKRKCNHENPFFLPVTKRRWSKTHSKYQYFNANRHIPNGIRFTVSKKDVDLVHDIFWAEIYGNYTVQDRLKGLAALLDFPLAHYQRINTKKPLKKLPKYGEIKSNIADCNLPFYLKIHMLRKYMSKKRLARFRHDIEDMFDWDGLETEEERLADKKLPDPELRLGGVELRLTYKHSSEDYYVFEVFHSGQLPEKSTESNEHDCSSRKDSLDDIPF